MYRSISYCILILVHQWKTLMNLQYYFQTHFFKFIYYLSLKRTTVNRGHPVQVRNVYPWKTKRDWWAGVASSSHELQRACKNRCRGITRERRRRWRRRDEMREKRGRDQSKGTRERDEETFGSVTRLELGNGNHKSVIVSGLSKAKYNYRLLREWSSMPVRARTQNGLFVSSIVEELGLLRTYDEEPWSSSTRSSDVIIDDKINVGIETFLHFCNHFCIS